MPVVQPSATDMDREPPALDDGTYEVTVTGFEKFTGKTKFPDKNTYKVFLEFSELDDAGQPMYLDPLINLSWYENSNLYRLAKACIPSVTLDSEFNTDDLIGKVCQISVVTPPDGKWPKVMAYMPVRRRTQATTRSAPVTAAREEDEPFEEAAGRRAGRPPVYH